MKTQVECLPCLLRQALQVARLLQCPEPKQGEIFQAVCAVISGLDLSKTPPANAVAVYRKIAEITGCEDPYAEIKRVNNAQALAIVPELRREIRGTDQELLSAVRFAIAGNIIDYGAFETFDLAAALARCRTAALAVDHFHQFDRAISRLDTGGKVLYLADNCGEIVYDSLLVEYLWRRGLEITVAVKSGPIINDALKEDALTAGLDSFARIIANGGRVPGTELAHCSAEFVEQFYAADLVIAKGQGNFETLSEVDREIFFLLTIKCAVAARHMAVLSGVEAGRLKGNGEMAVYSSAMKQRIGDNDGWQR